MSNSLDFSSQGKLDGDDLEGPHARQVDIEGAAGGARDALVGDGEVFDFALEDLQETSSECALSRT